MATHSAEKASPPKSNVTGALALPFIVLLAHAAQEYFWAEQILALSVRDH